MARRKSDSPQKAAMREPRKVCDWSNTSLSVSTQS